MDDGVLEMRLVVTAADYEAALAFYRDVLRMREVAVFSSPGGRVTILDAGRATLELGDPGHAAYVDEVEVGRRVAGHMRVGVSGSRCAGGNRSRRDRRGRAYRRAHRDPVALAQCAAERTRRAPTHALRGVDPSG